MKPLNKTATKIFMTIIENAGEHKTFDNKPGFMPLHVEKLYTVDVGSVYSFAHYYKLNGDMMKDPDMEFIVTKAGQIFPKMFQMDAPPIYEESIFYNEKWKVRPALQKQHVSFANMWFTNIKAQQNIK